MHRSTLERLIGDPFWARYTTQLRVCYRCHPSILSVVNTHYNNTLTTPHTGGEFSLYPLTNRVKWIHVSGTEEYEEDSPSVMNPEEVDQVILEVTHLVREKRPSPNDIAIIAPYTKQVQCIRRKLCLFLRDLYNRRIAELTCGTVEAFQGREAKAVILSSVRSPDMTLTNAGKQVADDVRRYLGFVRQPQRANVATSRAIDYLIVVGNMGLLGLDPTWSAMMEASGYRPPPPPHLPGLAGVEGFEEVPTTHHEMGMRRID